MEETDKNLKATKLNDIRNKYILQKIFDLIYKNNSLNIIRYNKAIQNKLDINIDTYKEYSQIIFDIKLFNQEGKLMLKKREGAKVRMKMKITMIFIMILKNQILLLKYQGQDIMKSIVKKKN